MAGKVLGGRWGHLTLGCHSSAAFMALRKVSPSQVRLCHAGWGAFASLPPQPEQCCLTVPDRQVSSCSQDPQIWRLGSVLVPRCPSLPQCPLPSVTALLLSCGKAGSNVNPMCSICARCSGCAPQCVSCHLRYLPENAVRESLLQVV